MANERVTKHEDTISATLKTLTARTVTIDSLHRTQIGTTVNKLRKCEATKIAEASQGLVLAWKALVERGDRTGVRLGEAKAAPRPSSSPSQSSHPPVPRGSPLGVAVARRTDVLDSVRDDRGRVERRIADPDSHEDQLALREAAEAERMWEEQARRQSRHSCCSVWCRLRWRVQWRRRWDVVVTAVVATAVDALSRDRPAHTGGVRASRPRRMRSSGHNPNSHPCGRLH